MGEPVPKPRPGRALAWGIAWAALVQGAFWAIVRGRLDDRVHDWWWRGYEGFGGSFAHRALDRLWHIVFDALPSASGTALVAAMVALPLAFLARTLARASVRAGHADPLDRVRSWMTAHPRRARAAVAAGPALWAVHAVMGAENFFPQRFVLAEHAWIVALLAAVAGLAATGLERLARRGVAALLAPTLEPTTKRAEDAKDEITFDAVAVTRETRGAVVAMAAASLTMTAWLATLPTHAIYHDGRVRLMVLLYALVALGGAFLFRRASKVAVGVDGVLVKGTSRTRFFAYRDLDAARVDAGDLELVRGERVVLRLQLHGEDAARRDAVLARIRDAIDRVKEGRGAVAAQLVSAASPAELARAAGGGADYRGAALTREQLWALIEGPEIESSARRAAGEALARSIDGDERARLRVAAEHCAAPEVRIALGRLAEAEATEDPADARGAAELARRSA